MNRIIWIALILSFFSSIAVGQETCCSIFEGLSFSSAAENNEMSSRQMDLHFCEEGSDSPATPNDHFHFCVCCSHTPFLVNERPAVREMSLPAKDRWADFLIFISKLYLDGPFQPPKS